MSDFSKRLFVVRCSLVVAVVFASYIASFGQEKLATDGGTLRISSQANDLRREQAYSAVREFVWTHWRQKSPGKIALSIPTIDYGPLVTRFTVRKNKRGAWEIEERYCEYCGRNETITKTIYESLDRVEKTSATEIPEAIPIDQVRMAQDYCVRLRSKDGAEYIL